VGNFWEKGVSCFRKPSNVTRTGEKKKKAPFFFHRKSRFSRKEEQVKSCGERRKYLLSHRGTVTDGYGSLVNPIYDVGDWVLTEETKGVKVTIGDYSFFH